jgi:hypothetical protein
VEGTELEPETAMYEVELSCTRAGKAKVATCGTLRECSRAARAYLSVRCIGNSGFTGGRVWRTEASGVRTEVARVSFNGRVWEPNAFAVTEITNLDR